MEGDGDGHVDEDRDRYVIEDRYRDGSIEGDGYADGIAGGGAQTPLPLFIP